MFGLFFIGSVIIFTVIRCIKISKIKIATKKGIFDFISLVIFISALTGVTIFSKGHIVVCIFDVVTIIMFLSSFFCQGILSDGIAVSSRGKNLYKWNEISDVEISKKKNVKITYYTKYSWMRTAKFRLDKYDEIIDILDKNEVEYKIENN